VWIRESSSPMYIYIINCGAIWGYRGVKQIKKVGPSCTISPLRCSDKYLLPVIISFIT
jgi:hypothetical protein